MRPGPPISPPPGPPPGPPLSGPLGPPPPLAGPLPLPPDLVTTGMIRRAELRKHLKINQQLKGITLVLVVLLLLLAYPVYLFAQSFAADPVFTELDKLSLPDWASYEHADSADGSRWCIGACRVRSRTWLSERVPDETQSVYAQALTEAGWQLRLENCPVSAEDGNVVTCWTKDEYILTLHVRAPLCVARPNEPEPTTTASGGSDTDAGSDSDADPDATPVDRSCPGALVTLKVANATNGPPPV